MTTPTPVPLREVIIPRSQWLRGPEQGGSSNHLWNSRRNGGCCLGHILLAHNYSKGDLELTGCPEDVPQAHIQCPLLVMKQAWGGGQRSRDTEISNKAMKINDDDLIPDPEREAKLIELFSPHLKLTFTD